MIAAGILLGPSCLNLLSDSLLNISADLRQLALIIILTRAGLTLDVAALKRVGRPAVLMCFLPACFEMAGMVLLAPRLLGSACWTRPSSARWWAPCPPPLSFPG